MSPTFKIIFLSMLITLLACSGGSSSSNSKTSALVGQSYTLNGIEEVTAIADDCLAGGNGDLASQPADVPISISFQDGNYIMNVDGNDALGGWSTVDSDTLSLDTTSDGTLEVDITISDTTMTMTLTDAWIAANCTGT